MAWFQRDHTGRDLLGNEREFVSALALQLAELRPPQVDESETALTAEGTACLIVLIPHRALGGISIVVWLFAKHAEVTWAQVGGLDCCHDSLDLGISVAGFRLDPKKPDFAPVLQSIREQFDQPLTLRCFGSEHATVLVRDHRGKLQKVGEIGRGEVGRGEVGQQAGWFGLSRRVPPTQETTIRLSDSQPPPVTSPSGVDEWFGSGGDGA
jgi:hypothetical protein